MRIVQMTLDEKLVREVDRVARELKTTRSAFTREALSQALHRQNQAKLEAQHRAGYRRKPVAEDEFGGWEKEQKWGAE